MDSQDSQELQDSLIKDIIDDLYDRINKEQKYIKLNIIKPLINVCYENIKIYLYLIYLILLLLLILVGTNIFLIVNNIRKI